MEGSDDTFLIQKDFAAWGQMFFRVFILFLTVSLEFSFPNVYFGGYLHYRVYAWGFCRGDVQFSQLYTTYMLATGVKSRVLSDLKEQLLDFDGISVQCVCLDSSYDTIM